MAVAGLPPPQCRGADPCMSPRVARRFRSDRRAGVGRRETHVGEVFTNRGCECATAPPPDGPTSVDTRSPMRHQTGVVDIGAGFAGHVRCVHARRAFPRRARPRRPRVARAALLPRRRRGAELHAGGRAAPSRPAGALRLGQAARGPAWRRPLRAHDAAGRADVCGRGPGRGGACRDGGGVACAREAPTGSRGPHRPDHDRVLNGGRRTRGRPGHHPHLRRRGTRRRDPHRRARLLGPHGGPRGGRGRGRLHLRPTAGRGPVGRDPARRAAPARGRPGAPVGRTRRRLIRGPARAGVAPGPGTAWAVARVLVPETGQGQARPDHPNRRRMGDRDRVRAWLRLHHADRDAQLRDRPHERHAGHRPAAGRGAAGLADREPTIRSWLPLSRRRSRLHPGERPSPRSRPEVLPATDHGHPVVQPQVRPASRNAATLAHGTSGSSTS